MAASNTLYSGDGVTTDFAIGFDYTSRQFVKVYVGGVITTAWSFLNATTIRFVSAPPSGTNNIEIRRVTSTSPLVDFIAAATITDTDLDLVVQQMLDVLEENQNNSIVGMQQTGGNWDATSDRIVNVSAPLASTDAANKAYVDSVIGSVADAEAAEVAAEAAAADALAQAGAASTSASTASAASVAATAALAVLTGVYPTSGMTAGHVLKAAGAADVDAVRAELKEFISSAAMSGAAADITLSGGYAEYEVVIEDFRATGTNEAIEARFSIDSAATYKAGASDYAWAYSAANSGGDTSAGDDADDAIRMTPALLTGSAGLRTRRLSFRLTMGDGTLNNALTGHGVVARNGGGVIAVQFGGEMIGFSTRATHLRLLFSGGTTFNAGTVKLYGISR